MIWGRPTNLWLGLATAIVGAISVTSVALGADPAIVATLSGAWGGVVGAIILVVANQPPTLSAGDTYTISTPKGQPNYEATVAAPPAATKPVVEG
jgi:hypothetical protein